jgi:hypothetical protein
MRLRLATNLQNNKSNWLCSDKKERSNDKEIGQNGFDNETMEQDDFGGADFDTGRERRIFARASGGRATNACHGASDA